jgi:hypothetical protein
MSSRALARFVVEQPLVVAGREGPNARRSFDGVDLFDSLNGFKIDVVDVRPVTNDSGPLNDATNLKQLPGGFYLTASIYGGLKLDLHDLQYENDAAK